MFHPGMFGNMGGGPAKNIDNEKYYKRLCIDKNANSSDIKKAYRKLAVQLHPDKPTGNEEKFKEISEAYEVLSNPEKKDLYDKYGEEGLDNDGPSSANDIFNMMFNNSNRGPKRRQRTKDVVSKIELSLEDMYNGKDISFNIKHKRICKICNGNGLKKNAKKNNCKVCGGKGVRIQIIQLGPGMIQQSQSPCNNCRGTGKIVKNEDKCQKCNGNQVCEETKNLTLHINKGTHNNEKIVFEGESDQLPDTDPGDIVFILVNKPHNIFKRKNNDLLIEKSITLTEALVGLKFTFVHLDGRKLLISNEGSVQPGEVKLISNEGMPINNDPFHRGNLFIKFNIKFPIIDKKYFNDIKKILNESDSIEKITDNNLEECVLNNYNGECYFENIPKDTEENVQQECVQQ